MQRTSRQKQNWIDENTRRLPGKANGGQETYPKAIRDLVEVDQLGCRLSR